MMQVITASGGSQNGVERGGVLLPYLYRARCADTDISGAPCDAVSRDEGCQLSAVSEK
jgi:hypothetical protein